MRSIALLAAKLRRLVRRAGDCARETTARHQATPLKRLVERAGFVRVWYLWTLLVPLCATMMDCDHPADLQAPEPTTQACQPVVTYTTTYNPDAGLPTAVGWDATANTPSSSIVNDRLHMGCAGPLGTTPLPGYSLALNPVPPGASVSIETTNLSVPTTGICFGGSGFQDRARAGVFVVGADGRAIGAVIERTGANIDALRVFDLNNPTDIPTPLGPSPIPNGTTPGANHTLRLVAGIGTMAIAFVDGQPLTGKSWPSLTVPDGGVGVNGPAAGLLAFGHQSDFGVTTVKVSYGTAMSPVDFTGQYCVMLHPDIPFTTNFSRDGGTLYFAGTSYIGGISGDGTIDAGLVTGVQGQVQGTNLLVTMSNGAIAGLTFDDAGAPTLLGITWQISGTDNGAAATVGPCPSCADASWTETPLDGGLITPYESDASNAVDVDRWFNVAHPGTDFVPGSGWSDAGHYDTDPLSMCHNCLVMPFRAMGNGCVEFAGRYFGMVGDELRWRNEVWLRLNSRYTARYVYQVAPNWDAPDLPGSAGEEQDELGRAQREQILNKVSVGSVVDAGAPLGALILDVPATETERRHPTFPLHAPSRVHFELFDRDAGDAGAYACPIAMFSSGAQSALASWAGVADAGALCEAPACGSMTPMGRWSAESLRLPAPDLEDQGWNTTFDGGVDAAIIPVDAGPADPPRLSFACLAQDGDPYGYFLPATFGNIISIEIQAKAPEYCAWADDPAPAFAAMVSDGARVGAVVIRQGNPDPQLFFIDAMSTVIGGTVTLTGWGTWTLDHILRLTLTKNAGSNGFQACVRAPSGSSMCETRKWNAFSPSAFSESAGLLSIQSKFEIRRIDVGTNVGTCP